MAKIPRVGEEVFIAPNISGHRDKSGNLHIIDENSGDPLYPDNNIEHKIRIFERQVNGWFLEQASNLLDKHNTGFVILMIVIAYIEGVEQYRQGNSRTGGSRVLFKDGLNRIFKIDSDRSAGILYSEIRCGLFHNGMTGPNIRLNSSYKQPIDFSDDVIVKINPELFFYKVKEDFKAYLVDLRNKSNEELRERFSSVYKFTDS